MGRLLQKSVGGEAAHLSSVVVSPMAASSHEGVELASLLLRGAAGTTIPDDCGRGIQGRRTRGRGVDVRSTGDRRAHPLGENPGYREKPVETVDAVADLVSHRDVLGRLDGLAIDAHVSCLAGTRCGRAGLDLPHTPQPDIDTCRRRPVRVAGAGGPGLRTSCHGSHPRQTVLNDGVRISFDDAVSHVPEHVLER